MDAFAALVRRFEKPVVHFIFRMVGSLQDAEDLAQDSFVRVYRYLDRLKPDAKFSTVLFGMAHNLTLNFLRDSARRGRGRTESMTRSDETQRLIKDNSRTPDQAARLKEVEALIERGLGLLSPDHREILMLRELQGLEYDAIASIVRCRKGTVKSRLARAREQLRARLIELGGEWI
jgi:RNA polymerase sigma-70 factor (ECF subfamily)